MVSVHFSGSYTKKKTTKISDDKEDSSDEDSDNENTCCKEQSELRNSDEGIFHAWECVSLLRVDGTTLDLAVPDHTHLMALIHFAHTHVYKPEEQKRFRGAKMKNFLSVYRKMKFQMKFSYESWNRKLT